MSYTATITSTTDRYGDNRRTVTLLVVEAGASSGSEWNTSGIDIPRHGYISFQCERKSGTSTTVQPIIGKVTGGGAATRNQVRTTAVAAAYVEDGPFPYVFAKGQDAILYGISQFTAGTDNAADWVIVIEES